MSKIIGMISLGCPKNQVDGEIMLSKLKNAGFKITGDVEEADLVIVNTCGFIDDAKKEAIENILYVADLKNQGIVKGLIVTGCLAERYKDEVLKEIPEIDGIIGIGGNGDIVGVCEKVLNGGNYCDFPSKYDLPLEGARLQTTPGHWTYLKIAEGCSNCCAYCAIPSIRGKFRSRKIDDIVAEANQLAESGVREIIVIAQDTTKYGIDLYGELMLPRLLNELCKIEGIKWIRLLYCYPDCLTDELIDTIATQEKVCNYIDLPLQHADEKVLKSMNRTGSRKELTALINKLRKKIPDVIIRTTFITGFPGESEENFTSLSEFVEEIQFDRLGCFAYSPEEGTVAAKMSDQIDDEIKRHRGELIMQQQYEIFQKKQHSKIGRILKVLVDEFDEENCLYLGRSYMDAPEIDSSVIISTERELIPGEFVDVKIIAVNDYDLVGEVVD